MPEVTLLCEVEVAVTHSRLYYTRFLFSYKKRRNNSELTFGIILQNSSCCSFGQILSSMDSIEK